MQEECHTFWTGLEQLWTLVSITCNRHVSAQQPLLNTCEPARITHSPAPTLAFLISQYDRPNFPDWLVPSTQR